MKAVISDRFSGISKTLRRFIRSIIFRYKKYRVLKHLFFTMNTCTYGFSRVSKAMYDLKYQCRLLAKALKDAKEVS